MVGLRGMESEMEKKSKDGGADGKGTDIEMGVDKECGDEDGLLEAQTTQQRTLPTELTIDNCPISEFETTNGVSPRQQS